MQQRVETITEGLREQMGVKFQTLQHLASFDLRLLFQLQSVMQSHLNSNKLFIVSNRKHSLQDFNYDEPLVLYFC